MIRMSESAMRKMVNNRVAEDEMRGYKGLEFHCIRNANRDKWHLVLVVDETGIMMSSQREDRRSFASLDSAHKVATSIINSMLVIGK